MNYKIIISFLSLIIMISLSDSNAQKFKETEKTFQMNKDGKVTIETYKGEIIVETWDKPEVYVYAKMIPDDSGFLSTSPKKQLERVEVEFDATQNSVWIKSDYKKSHSFFGSNTQAFVKYRIKMPKTAELKINDYKSETKINGLESHIQFETYKGEVKIYNHSGSIDLETYKGEVRVEYAKLTDRSRFETYKGEIDITVPKNFPFTIEADLNKKVDFRSKLGIEQNYDKKKKGYYFSKDINGGGPDLKISSDKGEIRLNEK